MTTPIDELNPSELAAIAEVQPTSPTWRPYFYDQQVNGLLIKGCNTTTYSRGSRKGQTKYLTKEGNKTVLVTPEMAKRFEGENNEKVVDLINSL